MKKLFLIFGLLNALFANAQPYTLLPDTLTLAPITAGHRVLGIDLVPLPNNHYALLTRNNEMGYVELIIIDSTGHKTDYKAFRSFGTNKYIFPASHSFLQLKNKTWLLPSFVQQVGVVNNYNGLMIFNEALDSVLYKKVSKTMFQGNYTESAYGWATYSRDSSNIWIVGSSQPGASAPTQFFLASVTHLDSTAHSFISDCVVSHWSRFLSARWIIPTSDGQCIVSGQAQVNSGGGDQIFVAKVGDTGLVWYKEVGSPDQPDFDGYMFRGSTDTTYRLFYIQGRRYDNSNLARMDLHSMVFDNMGNITDSSRVMAIDEYVRIYSHLQLADGSILLGLYGYDGYAGRFVKFSRTGQLLWTSMIPLPNLGQYSIYGAAAPARALPTPDGGFLCTGEYSNPLYTPENVIWVGKMDSTGCWENCVVATSPLNPPKGDFLRVFPNPAQNQLTIQTPTHEIGDIIIYDLYGRVVVTKPVQNGEITIPTATWANGVYFYRYQVGDKTLQSGKIEIIK